jgi:hypothetical protein
MITRREEYALKSLPSGTECPHHENVPKQETPSTIHQMVAEVVTRDAEYLGFFSHRTPAIHSYGDTIPLTGTKDEVIQKLEKNLEHVIAFLGAIIPYHYSRIDELEAYISRVKAYEESKETASSH